MSEESELKNTIGEATKVAMKARDKSRVAVLWMVNADIKRMEVDERRTLADVDVVTILKKMVKQRQESLTQYRDAGRTDLADQEAYEIEVIETFLPAAMSDADLEMLVEQCIETLGASGMQDMGKVMAAVKESSGGQADMGKASGLVKTRLA